MTLSRNIRKELALFDSRLDRHDRTQVELKLAYGIRPDRKSQDYRVDIYLFVPKVLGVSRYSYPSERFYAETTTFIRLTSPKVPLEELSEKDSVRPWARSLKAVLKNGRSEPGEIAAAERSLKLLACVFKSSIRDARTAVREPLQAALRARDAESAASLISGFAEDVRTARRRLVKVGAPAGEQNESPRLKDAWAGVDEYSSLLAEEALTDLVVVAEEAGLGSPVEEALDKVRDLAIEQYRHRRSCGYRSYAAEGERNEFLPHRWRVLKRFVSSALYLHVSRESSGALFTDLIGMLAAGLAMLFATLALIFIQAVWATSLSIAFVSSMVVAYIIKDRIKELAKRHLGRRLNRMLADHKVVVMNELGEEVGTVKEAFDVRSVGEVPKEVLDLRYADLTSHEAVEGRPERVMHYAKQIQLSSAGLRQEFETVPGLTDVTRLNLSTMMGRMDDVWETYRFIHPTRRVLCEERCGRVYHLNVVLRLRDEDGEVELTRARLVVDKKGIRRVEDVSLPGAVESSRLVEPLDGVVPVPIRIDED